MSESKSIIIYPIVEGHLKTIQDYLGDLLGFEVLEEQVVCYCLKVAKDIDMTTHTMYKRMHNSLASMMRVSGDTIGDRQRTYYITKRKLRRLVGERLSISEKPLEQLVNTSIYFVAQSLKTRNEYKAKPKFKKIKKQETSAN